MALSRVVLFAESPNNHLPIPGSSGVIRDSASEGLSLSHKIFLSEKIHSHGYDAAYCRKTCRVEVSFKCILRQAQTKSCMRYSRTILVAGIQAQVVGISV